MAVFKATQNKSDSAGKFKATKNRSYDSALVSGWETSSKEAYDELEKYRRRINNGEYLSSDDLTAYQKALDRYVESSTSLRGVSRALGQSSNDVEWTRTVSQMKKGYKDISDYYSNWKTEEDYWTYINQQEENAKKMAELTNGYDPEKHQQEGKTGWDAYVAQKEQREKEKNEAASAPEEKEWWEKLLGYIGDIGSDTSLPGPGGSQVLEMSEGAKRKDTELANPTERWTDEERNRFGYLWNTERQKAFDYARAVNLAYAKQDEDAKIKGIQDSATDNFLAGAAHTLGAIATAPLGIADYLSDVIYQGAVGYVPEADGEVTPFEYSQAVTGGISNHLNDIGGTINENVPIFGGKGWGDVYGLGTSIVQSSLAALTGGSGQALVTFFGSAAASSVDDAVKRGVSGGPAVLYGTAMGAAEALAEMLGIDNLMKIGSSATLTQLFVNLFKQGGAEGLEEFLTAFFGNVADNFIIGEKSNFYLRAEAYMSAGFNEDEAKSKAWSEMFGDMVFDAIGGFVSGAVHAGPKTAYHTFMQNYDAKQTYGGSQKELVGEALEINPDNAFAKKMQTRLDKGKNLSGGQLSELVRQNESTMAEQDASKIQKAVEARLAELGETGDVSALAAALTKQAQNQTDYSKTRKEMDRLMAKGYSLAEALEMAGQNESQELSPAEMKLIENSKYGQRVANELNVDNIRSGNYSSQWTGDIETDRVHADVYNNDLMDLAMDTAGVSTKAAPTVFMGKQPQQDEQVVSTESNESHYEVSDDGKMVNIETGDVIEPQGLVKASDGTYKIAVKDADPVTTSNVRYSDSNQALVYETFVNLEGRYGKTNKVIGSMDLENRNALLGLYNPEINEDGGIFANGAVSAFFYGHQGIDLSAVPKTSPVWQLTEQQRKIAWNQGRIAGVKATNTAQSNVDTVYEEAQKVLKQTGKVKTGSYHAVLEDGITPMQLNEKQKAVYRVADDIAQGVQTNIRVYAGKNKAQGFYNHATDEIWLNLNAANKSREAIMAFTLAHELVHRGKKGSPAKYKAFVEFLMKEYGKQGTDVEALIAEQMAAAEAFDKTVPDSKKINMTREKAFEEVVCDACQRMLLDTNAGQKLAEFGAQSKQNKSFLEDLKRWISEFIEKLRNYFKGVDPDSKAAKEFAKFDENVKQILADMYVDMSIDAGEKLSTIKAAYGGAFAEKFLGIKDIQYNLAAVKTHKDKLQNEFSEDSSTDLESLMKRYNKIIDIWTRLGGELNSQFLADWNSKVGKDRTFTIFKAQAGYKYNVELSSMCKKGVPLFEAIDTIVKQEVMKELNLAVLGKAEKEILYDILKQHHFEIPCAICYVEQARQREGVIIDAFLNGKVEKNAKGEITKVKLGWNQVLDSIQKEMKANGVDYSFEQVSRDIATEKYTPAKLDMDMKTQAAFYTALKKIANQEIVRYNKAEGKSRKLLSDVTPQAVKECFKGTLPANLKIFKVLFEEPSSRFKITSDLLYSSVATQNLSMAHNKLYGLFNSQGGVSGYKTKQGTTIYWGDILGKSWKPDILRNEGGVRNQSNSDFQMYTLLDQAQMYIDFTAKGYYLQAYTKVLSELKLFGLSRGKINASLIPKVVVYLNAAGTEVDVERTMATAGLDENGNPIYDDIEGINHNEAFMLIEDPEYSKSICGICIGYSDAHILKLLDDNRVQQIIGFHDKTDDGSKRYKGAKYAKNYNGLNEAVNKDGKTVHIGFNPYVKKAEKKFKFNAETETFEGAVNYNGKTYTADDIPRLATDLYLEMCAKKGYTPAYKDFAGHRNYYKLLADFGLYDSQGHYAPHRKVVYNMPDTVPYLDANGKKQTMSTYDYIKAELVKEMAVRDSISEALADTSSEGIIPKFKAAVKKNQEAKSQAEDSQDEKSFSLSKSVEESADLVAFHNITEKLLWEALDRNGLVMPSIAVTNKGLNDFGEISLMFDKSVIDPATNKANKLYGADAWTPMQTLLKMNAKFDTNNTVRTVNTMKNRIGMKHVGELLDITPKQFKEAIIKADGNIYEAYAHNIGVQAAYAMEKGIISHIPTNKDGTVNQDLLQKQLDRTLDTDDGWRQYRRWLNNISDTVITSYDQATNEDILRHMKSQPSTAKTFKLSETGELIVPAKEYSSIKEMRRNKNRLSENAEEATKAVAAELMAFAKKVGDTQQVVEAINAGFKGRYNIADIMKTFRNNGINLSTKEAGELQSLYKKAVELPTQYFEAKPGGTVGLDMVNTAVVPSNTSMELRQALEEIGINVLEHDGTKESRIEALNSMEDLMFSLPKGDPAPTFYSLMARVVDGMKQEKFGASTVISTLRNKGVKAEEIKWSGIETFLEGKKSVSKAELQEFIAGSMLQIEEEILDNKDRPYTEEQQNRLDEYEAKRDKVAKRLADEWKKVTGDEFPIRNAGADLESSVVNKIIDANKEHKDASFEGRLLAKLRKDLEKVIDNNDDFGFYSWKDALRSIHRHRKDFITYYEMSTNDKAIIVKYCNALNAYNELPNKISDADTDRLRAIARETEPWNRKIMEVKHEHNEEEAKYMTNWKQYSLDGGKNYREMLFRIPGSAYTNAAMMAHWKERKGVLAHARVQDMDTFIGKMLFIEEIQSDWHNAGRKDGYRDPGAEDKYTLAKKMDAYTEEFFASPIADVVREKITAVGYEGAGVSMILNFLLESEDSMRSTLDRLGSSFRGDKAVSFTDSEVNEIAEYARGYEDLYHQWEKAPGDLTAPDAPFKETYHEYVLKRLIREAAEQDYDSIGWTTAETQDERWQNNQPHKEGTGKSGFLKAYTIEYDQNMRKFMSKFGDKWGTKVGKTVLDNGTEVWSMAITDEMKESVLYEGQVMYSLPKVEAITPTNEQVEQNIREIADMKPVHSVDASKLDKTGKRPSEIFTEYFDDWGWNIHSDELGDIEITPQSVRDEVRHGITAVKIASIEAIPPVIKQGKIIFAGQKPGTTVYRIVICAPITIGKNPYYMGVMLQRDANTQRLYLHNVVIEEETPTFSPADLLTTGANENNERLFITNILQAALNVKRQNQLDKEYMDAVNRGDMETAQRLVDQKAAEVGAKLIYDPDPDGFYVLKSNIPTKWVEAYKVFNMYDGEIYPLYIKNANKTPIPFRTWVGGKEGGRKYEALNGHAYVLGDTGQSHPRSAFSDEVWQQMVDDGVVKPNAKNSPKMLAYRPGWHGTSQPFFPQGGKKDGSSNYGKIHTANHVVCKVRFSKDVDLTQTAVDNAPLTKDGRPNMNEADLKYLPQENGKHGSYEYRTNRGIPPEVAKKSKWYVASAMYVESVLTQEEADSLLTKSGIPIQEWEGGSLDLTALGYSQDTVDANPKLRDAVTYGDDGNVIPLSERFNLDKNDVRYKLPIGEDTSPRALLSNAFEGIITNDIEKRRIQEYKGKVDMLNAEEQKLHELRSQIKELSFAKGKRDTKKIKDLQFDAIQTANRIATLDKILLRLEVSAPLQSILQREKEMAYKRAEQKGKEALEAYKKAERERDKQWQSEVKEKYLASKKKAIETREKREAREKLQKLVLDTVNWITYPSKTDVKCPDILKQPYADFLNGIDLSSKRLADGGDPTKNDLRLANAMGSLATALDKIMTSQDPNQETEKVLDTGYLDLPANFVQKLRDMTENVKAMMVDGDYVVNNMSAAEVRQLSQMIRTLNHAIKEVSTLYANLRFANVEALGHNTMSFMDDLGEIDKTSGMKDFVQWENALPYYAFKRFGEGGESVFEGLMDAQDKLAFLAQEIFDFRDKAWTDKEAKEWSEDTHTITLPDGNPLTLTTADAMSIYCLSRREQGLQHLLGGGTRVVGIQKGSQKAKDSRSTLTIQDISAINSSLTDRQIAVADAIQSFMSTVCSEWGNEISMKRFLTKEFNEKFYFPIESNDENLPTKDPAAQQSDLFRLLNISATKPLTPGANNEVIIRNIFDVFTGHASDMARLNAYGMALLDYMKWLNYREKTVNNDGQIKVRGVRKSMEKAYGNAAKSYVLNLVKDVNGRPSDGGDPTILMKWMRNAKTASVGANLRVAALQFTSYPRAALVLSTRSIALGLTKAPQVAKAKKYCGIALWKSFGFYDTNIARSIEDQMKGVTNIRQKIIELSMKGAEWGDAITWGCLWNACEYEVAQTTKNKVGSEEFYQEVGKKLREVIYATQVVDSTLTRSQLMRSKRGMAQEAASFMSEPTLTTNILMDAGFQFEAEKRRTGSVKAAWANTGKHIGRAVAVYSCVALLVALVESLGDAWRDDDEEEFYEKFFEALPENVLLNLLPFNKVPIVSDVFELALSLLDVGFFSSEKLSTQWLSQTATAVDAWGEVFSGKSTATVYGALYKTVKALSSTIGVPFSGALREVVALWNNTAGSFNSAWKLRTYGQTQENLRDGLYDAIVSGNQKQVESIQEEFRKRADNDKDYQSTITAAIRKALRDNDPRIKEAAQAVVDGNAAERANIAREIVAEGHFSLQDIQAAINAEIDKIRKEAKDK